MRIVLLRHGHHKNNHLTQIGKKQVKLITKELAQFDFDQIISSPASRCKETASVVCKAFKKDFIVDDRLNERFNLNKAIETKEEQDWWDNYLNINFESTIPDAFNVFYKRNSECFDEYIKKNEPEKDILFVLHSAGTYAFLRYHGKLKETIWQSIAQGTYICYEYIDNKEAKTKSSKTKK